MKSIRNAHEFLMSFVLSVSVIHGGAYLRVYFICIMKNNLKYSHPDTPSHTHTLTHTRYCSLSSRSQSKEKLKLFHSLLPVLVLYQLLTMMALGLHTLQHLQTAVGYARSITKIPKQKQEQSFIKQSTNSNLKLTECSIILCL